ncbi:Asp23/Gls24 family envelope stress response protein [Leucobacter komagatae]|uniref:Alkaline-shock protein n=1 Tax=Leucobacter komagatae TaxID=55969 RepID=A0A0D0IHV0_9MICO|nr:Asp23/Gls24 family envelope stress response protein [Leucobacter komagatae]KIP51259.1 alkaline-shock protein [Leucobacter komagatae]
MSKIAGIAAREVPGVHALGGGAARAIGAVRAAVGPRPTTRPGHQASRSAETQVAADVKIIAEYPVSLQQVADDVRAAVGQAIEDLVGMQVAEINVTIADVFIPSDDNDDEDESRVK